MYMPLKSRFGSSLSSLFAIARTKSASTLRLGQPALMFPRLTLLMFFGLTLLMSHSHLLWTGKYYLAEHDPRAKVRH